VSNVCGKKGATSRRSCLSCSLSVAKLVGHGARGQFADERRLASHFRKWLKHGTLGKPLRQLARWANAGEGRRPLMIFRCHHPAGAPQPGAKSRQEPALAQISPTQRPPSTRLSAISPFDRSLGCPSAIYGADSYRGSVSCPERIIHVLANIRATPPGARGPVQTANGNDRLVLLRNLRRRGRTTASINPAKQHDPPP